MILVKLLYSISFNKLIYKDYFRANLIKGDEKKKNLIKGDEKKKIKKITCPNGHNFSYLQKNIPIIK